MTRAISRRTFLRGSGGLALALPFLAQFAPRRALAAGPRPKRLVVVHHRQGTVLQHWVPTGTSTQFTLPAILEPLAPFQDRLVVIAGLDNKIPSFNTAGNGHDNAETSILTCQPFQDPSSPVLVPAGPSLEHVIAGRISGGRPHLRLDFGVGGGRSGNGLVVSNEFWAGPGDPITFTSDPQRMLVTLFGGQGDPEEEVQRLRARRMSVLDAVKDNFSHLRRQLDVSDRARLDAHAEKIRQLEQRVQGSSQGCTRPSAQVPAGYDYGFDDNHTVPVHTEILVSALSCGLTNVATLWFAQGHDPTFPWLDVNGGPVVPTGRYDNWHAMVHEGRAEQGLVVGFHWYAQQFALLLGAMASAVDEDGDNLLDTSLVMWTTDFGNGAGHNTNKIPYVLAGCVGGASTGRFLDFMNGGPDADWTPSDATTGQLYVSILQAFGGEDQTFGFTHPSLPDGPLPGLLG